MIQLANGIMWYECYDSCLYKLENKGRSHMSTNAKSTNGTVNAVFSFPVALFCYFFGQAKK